MYAISDWQKRSLWVLARNVYDSAIMQKRYAPNVFAVLADNGKRVLLAWSANPVVTNETEFDAK